MSMPNVAKAAPKVHRSSLYLYTWFERDRALVQLRHELTGRKIVEWWDEEVNKAIEDGFLDPRDYEGSAIRYAESVGLVRLYA